MEATRPSAPYDGKPDIASRDAGLALPSTDSTAPPPRLLDRVRQACRVRHLSRRTEDPYVAWIRRFTQTCGNVKDDAGWPNTVRGPKKTSVLWNAHFLGEAQSLRVEVTGDLDTRNVLPLEYANDDSSNVYVHAKPEWAGVCA